MSLIGDIIRQRIAVLRETLASLRQPAEKPEPWGMPAQPPDGLGPGRSSREAPRRWWELFAPLWRWWWEDEVRVEPPAPAAPPAPPPPPRPRPPRVGRRLVWGFGDNRYAAARDPEREEPTAELRGCRQDIINVYPALEALGWTTLTPLFDMSRAFAIERLGNYCADLRRDDRLVIWWSSHGTHAEDPREPDGLVEALCPYDALVDWPRNLITARDLSIIFRDVADGARVIMGVDACHSAVKDVDLLARALFSPGRDRRPKFLEPPVPVTGKTRMRALLDRPGDVAAPWQRDALLAACESDQTAADSKEEGMYQGAFTWSFLKALRGTQSASLSELRANASRLLAANRYSQLPRLVGSAESFGLTLDS